MIRYTIHQLILEEGNESAVYAFSGKKFILGQSTMRFPPPKDLYAEIYTDSQNRFDPDEVFYKFNNRYPNDYMGRSLSISDVLQYYLPNGEMLYLYCDNVGFEAIDFGPNHQVAKEAEYTPPTDFQHETVTFYYHYNDGLRSVTVDIDMLLAGEIVAMDHHGNNIDLTMAEIYNALKEAIKGRNRIRENEKPNSAANQKLSSSGNVLDYLNLGEFIIGSILGNGEERPNTSD